MPNFTKATSRLFWTELNSLGYLLLVQPPSNLSIGKIGLRKLPTWLKGFRILISKRYYLHVSL